MKLRIAKAVAIGESGTPKYVQRIECGKHTSLADEPQSRGGQDAGLAPFDYLMAGLAACTSITLRMYAERKGWDLGTVSVEAELWREKDASRVERKVSVSAALDDAQRAKLADICERTPVTLALKQGVAISTTIENG